MTPPRRPAQPQNMANEQSSNTAEELRRLTANLLAQLPAAALSPPVAAALRLATPAGVREAATLLATDQTDAAAEIYRVAAAHPALARWSAVERARLAARNPDGEAAASAWHTCLALFADDPEPWWWIELARAERNRGQMELAEVALRRCSAAFPDYPHAAAVLADLLAAIGQPDAAMHVWRDALARFAAAAQPWWFTALAGLLRDAGQRDAETAVLDDLATRFPGNAQADLGLAWAASRRAASGGADWERAARLWAMCLDRHQETANPDWYNAHATALLRLWRPAEAIAAWNAAITRFPDAAIARAGRLNALIELGAWPEAETAAADLVAMLPEGGMHPAGVSGEQAARWLALRGRCQLELLQDAEVLATIAALRARYPASPLGDLLAINRALRLQARAADVLPLVADARHRFPRVRELAAQHVWLLLATGRDAAAAAVAAELAADGMDHWSLLSRWRVIEDRDGTATLRAVVETEAEAQSWEPDAALAIASYLRELWSIWANELALAVLRRTEAGWPGQVATRCAIIRALIALRRDTEATALIDALPVACRSQVAMELRAWVAARRGDLGQARAHFAAALAGTYAAGLHAPAASLECLTPERASTMSGGVPPGVSPGVIGFLVARDEIAHLPNLLAHHRRLGVARFVVIDHGSRDNSVAYLRAQPDVLLYRTDDDFHAAASGMHWVNALMARHAAGHWCLLVDADEAWIYPGCERMSLPGLTAYLDSQGAEAMAGFMLDVFPPRLDGPTDADATGPESCWFDNNYDWLGHVRPPYAQPVGGGRARLFDAPEYLHKVPLLRAGAARYLDPHETTPVRLADVTGALLHGKLAALARGFNAANKAYGPEVSRRYRRYTARLVGLLGQDLRTPGVSHALRDSHDLLDRGLLRASPAYRAWLDEWPVPEPP